MNLSQNHLPSQSSVRMNAPVTSADTAHDGRQAIAAGATAALGRWAAYLLFFASGAAAMFAVDRSFHIDSRERSDSPQSYAVIARVSPSTPEPEATSSAEPAGVSSTPVVALPAVEPPGTAASSFTAAQVGGEIRVTGQTEPAPGRFAKLGLATSQAVAFVDVKPGDRVKKGWQVFSHWESPERLRAYKSEIDQSKKVVDLAKTRSTAAVQTVERLKALRATLPAQEIQDAETAAAIRQGELEAAQLALAEAESRYTAMEFEFNQAFVTSPLDGVVAAVDIYPGERRQPGTTFRGVTILDPRLLGCRCYLSPQQLPKVRLQQSVSPRNAASASSSSSSPDSSPEFCHAVVRFDGSEWLATVTSIGVLADPKTELIPVFLEVQNPRETLPCGIKVEVCFRDSPP